MAHYCYSKLFPGEDCCLYLHNASSLIMVYAILAIKIDLLVRSELTEFSSSMEIL